MAKKTQRKRDSEPDELERDEDELGGDESDQDDSADDEDADDEDADDEDADADDEDADDDDEDADDDEGSDEEASNDRDGDNLLAEGEEPAEGETPTNLGATKYVHAAFFAAGILVAFLSGRILGTIWNSLAEWPTAVRSVPQLLAYSEDERPTFTMAAGALVGVLTVINVYRKEHIRRWADEVAAELSKVTWPARDAVTNGTVVVVIASFIATIYVSLLDRLWGFLTGLVYGV